MAWQRADLEKLERAIASGQQTVRYKDRQVSYQSLDAMIRARREMKAEVDAAEGKRPRRRIFRITQTGKGL